MRVFLLTTLLLLAPLPSPLWAQDSSEQELTGILDAFEQDNTGHVQGKKVSLRSLQFETGTNKLTTDDKVYLTRIVEHLRQLPTVSLLLEGHTDNVGNAQFNQRLSERRAEAVKLYLIASGATKERIQSAGFGATRPIAPNTTEKGRLLNRRVELMFTGISDETHTIRLADGREITAQFIMVNKDGSIGYKETLKSPMKKLKPLDINYVRFANGVNYSPKNDPIVKKLVVQNGTLQDKEALFKATYQPRADTSRFALIYVFRPTGMMGKGTNYSLFFNGQPVQVIEDGTRLAYKMYSVGTLEVKTPVNDGVKLGELTKEYEAANSVFLNAVTNNAAARVGTASVLTKAIDAGIKNLSNKNASVEIVKDSVYYFRIEGLTGALRQVAEVDKAAKEYATDKKFKGSALQFKERLVDPVPRMSLYEEVESQKRQFLQVSLQVKN
jgi:outer membrane protein OmpA-like peptidoglycan-associated protein